MNLGTQLHNLADWVEMAIENKIAWNRSLFNVKAIDFAEDYQGKELELAGYTPETLLTAVCAALNMSPEYVKGNSRKRDAVGARRFYCAFAKLHLKHSTGRELSLGEIAAPLKYHHSTVIHNLRQHRNYLATDADYALEWRRFEKRLS